MSEPNTETLNTLLAQLGGILGVGRRADGRRYLSDMCVADSINMWALYRPFQDFDKTPVNATETNRLHSDYGLLMTSDLDSDDSKFSRMIYEINLPKVGDWKRLLDFDGYNHLAKCGFALTPTSFTYPSVSTAYVKMEGDTGDNIAWKHLAAIIESTSWDNLTRFGLEVRSKKSSMPLYRKEIGDATQLQSTLASSYGMAISSLADNPPGIGAELYIYGYNYITDERIALHEPVTINDSRQLAPSTAVYHHYAPNMQVGTFLSGLKTVNEWWLSSGTITIGSQDFFRLGFYIRNESSSQMIFMPRLKVKANGKVYYLRIYYLSSGASISIPSWGTLGPTSYSGSPSFYCSWADFADILSYGVETSVTMQICNYDVVTQKETAILTAPMTLKVKYNGNDVTDRDNYPEFPPISEPDWSGGFDI